MQYRKFGGLADPYDAQYANLTKDQRWAGVVPAQANWQTQPLANDLRNVANASELKQYRWFQFSGSNEHWMTVGQETSTLEDGSHPRPWNKYAPGPLDPENRMWSGSGLAQNIEQFAFLHGNPTPIFNVYPSNAHLLDVFNVAETFYTACPLFEVCKIS